MFIHDKTKKPVVTAGEAGERLGIDPSNIRQWAMKGEIKPIRHSARLVVYFLEDVERLSREKTETRKKRGGRPRKDPDAA